MPTDDSLVIRRIQRSDVATYRDIRLRALQESPSAFGSTYAAESVMTDEQWVERVTDKTEGPDRAMFLAFDGKECIGLAGCLEDEYGADRQLISMWVAPKYRGTGVAADLVDAVLAWAEASGASNVALWVTNGNDRARRLYERLGFVETGDVQPLPSDPCKDEIRMLRQFVASSA